MYNIHYTSKYLNFLDLFSMPIILDLTVTLICLQLVIVSSVIIDFLCYIICGLSHLRY